MKEAKTEGVRPAVAAGRFYPRDPAELRHLVQSLLAEVTVPTGPGPKALIAPHAGFVYSGPIAASAYAQWIPDREVIRRVVLLGPSHFVPLKGLAASPAEAFTTPLGVVPVDLEAMRALEGLRQVSFQDDAHAFEHALEVQLPFLQVVLKDFAIVPLVAGEADPEETRLVLDALWDGPETRFVVSSDLSHYLDWETARRMDQRTAEAIAALRLEDIGEQQACGRIPIRGLLQAAREHGLRARVIDLRTSGDTAGSRDQVVGYGAFALEEPAK